MSRPAGYVHAVSDAGVNVPPVGQHGEALVGLEETTRMAGWGGDSLRLAQPTGAQR